MKSVLRVGVIGMGGFAGVHHNTLVGLEKAGECRVVCTCDPAMARFTKEQETLQFAARGVKTYGDYKSMLAAHGQELEVLIIPTPVPLHAEMHAAAVKLGIPAYLEKPPTLDYRELEAMIALEPSAKKLTNVPFSYIVEEPRRELKRRLLAGEFGRLLRVGISGSWPRAESYFQRTFWAGRLLLNERLVLDSCFGNAISHCVHNGLFWAGQGEVLSWGEIASVSAELYRGHAIEGTDTVFTRATTTAGIELRMAFTHDCAGGAVNHEWFETDQARLVYTTGADWRIEWHNGKIETGLADRRTLLAANLRWYFDYVRGLNQRPLTRLVDARPFVTFNDLLYLASGKITTLAAPHLTRQELPGATPEYFRVLAGVQAAIDQLLATGKLPAEQGRPWAVAGGSATPAALPGLETLVRRLSAESGWQG